MQKSTAIKVLKVVSIIYALFITFFGIIFMSVEPSIPFLTLEEARQCKIDIILCSAPCIVVGVAILLLYIFYFVLKMQKINIYDKPLYVYLTLIVSIILLVGAVALTIFTKQLALILLTIFPTLCMLSVGVVMVVNYKKYSKNCVKNA